MTDLKGVLASDLIACFTLNCTKSVHQEAIHLCWFGRTNLVLIRRLLGSWPMQISSSSEVWRHENKIFWVTGCKGHNWRIQISSLHGVRVLWPTIHGFICRLKRTVLLYVLQPGKSINKFLSIIISKCTKVEWLHRSSQFSMPVFRSNVSCKCEVLPIIIVFYCVKFIWWNLLTVIIFPILNFNKWLFL